MTFRICIFNDILIRSARFGSEVVYKCTAEGAEGDSVSEFSSDKLFRTYVCMNCGVEMDSFSNVRMHLGKKHEMVDPFIIKKVTP